MDFAETIRGIFGGQSSQAPPTGEDYASDLKPMVDAGAEVRRKPRLSFDLYPPKPDHDPVLGDILRSKDKVPSPDFIAPPPGLGQAPDRVPSDMQYERPPNVLSENAARGIAASAVEPFGQAGRLATGGSEDVAGDLAGVGAAVAPIPGAGIGKAIGKAAKAGIEGAEHATTGGVADMIKAYHGSPHDFDRFDLSKIGTGEGAQAYGHGLYFAENEGVAKGYRDALGPGWKLGDKTVPDADALRGIVAQKTGVAGDHVALQDAVDDLRNGKPLRGRADYSPGEQAAYDKAANVLREAKPAGKMYQVGIRANPEHFLDWDKPLSEQPKAVQEILGTVPHVKKMNEALTSRGHPELTGGSAYTEARYASPDKSSEKVMQQLRETGIPGIKYLDQGSRMSDEASKIVANYGSREKALDIAKTRLAAAEKTMGAASDRKYWSKIVDEIGKPESRNFVVFDDKLIDILKKYGIAGIGALPAMNAFHYQDKQ